jgi:hypothetical protein
MTETMHSFHDFFGNQGFSAECTMDGRELEPDGVGGLYGYEACAIQQRFSDFAQRFGNMASWQGADFEGSMDATRFDEGLSLHDPQTAGEPIDGTQSRLGLDDATEFGVCRFAIHSIHEHDAERDTWGPFWSSYR